MNTLREINKHPITQMWQSRIPDSKVCAPNPLQAITSQHFVLCLNVLNLYYPTPVCCIWKRGRNFYTVFCWQCLARPHHYKLLVLHSH